MTEVNGCHGAASPIEETALLGGPLWRLESDGGWNFFTPGRDCVKRSKERTNRRKTDFRTNAFYQNRFCGNSLLRRGIAGMVGLKTLGKPLRGCLAPAGAPKVRCGLTPPSLNKAPSSRRTWKARLARPGRLYAP